MSILVREQTQYKHLVRVAVAREYALQGHSVARPMRTKCLYCVSLCRCDGDPGTSDEDSSESDENSDNERASGASSSARK